MKEIVGGVQYLTSDGIPSLLWELGFKIRNSHNIISLNVYTSFEGVKSIVVVVLKVLF